MLQQPLETVPVTARSAVLSLLLGVEPPTLPARDIVAAMDHVGVSGATTRVALSRMVSAGDLHREIGTYTLSERLVARQRRQHEAIEPRTLAWRGDWELVVVTASGRQPTERAELRTGLDRLRLAELREGVWMRPDNLARRLPSELDTSCRCLTARPVEDPVELARDLWDLDAWAGRGRRLLDLANGTEDPATRFAAMAYTVRHLLTDPVLPAEVVPTDWPGDPLRAAYAGYRDWLQSMRPSVRPSEENS